MKDYSGNYSSESFWSLIKKHGSNIPFLEDILAMYYCLIDPETPMWVKPLIIAALGYVICPLDLIPDFIPVGGWTDDAGVVAAAMAVIAVCIKPEHRQKAREALGKTEEA